MKFLIISLISALSHISMNFPKRGASGRLKHMKRHCVYKVSEQERKRCSKSQKHRILKILLQKSLISRILHENHENARSFMKFHENHGLPTPKSLKTLRNYNGFGKGWRRGWK
jgi:hypothetical protein